MSLFRHLEAPPSSHMFCRSSPSHMEINFKNIFKKGQIFLMCLSSAIQRRLLLLTCFALPPPSHMDIIPPPLIWRSWQLLLNVSALPNDMQDMCRWPAPHTIYPALLYTWLGQFWIVCYVTSYCRSYVHLVFCQVMSQYVISNYFMSCPVCLCPVMSMSSYVHVHVHVSRVHCQKKGLTVPART